MPQYRQSSENSKNSPRISATLGVVTLPYLSRALIYNRECLPRRSIRALAIALVALLSLGACSHDDGDPNASPSDIRSTMKSTSVASDHVSGASMTSTSFRKPSDISIKVPTITTARNLSQAIEVVRERTLRGAAWDSATKVTMTGHFISSTTDLLGVELQAEVTKGKTTSQSTTTLWYDATMKQTLSASALISWPGWPKFSQEVVKSAHADGLNGKKAEAALQQPQAPMAPDLHCHLTPRGPACEVPGGSYR